MCETCETSGRQFDCPTCNDDIIKEECDCIEGVFFFINDKPVIEEVYNNHPIESEKRFELCENCK